MSERRHGSLRPSQRDGIAVLVVDAHRLVAESVARLLSQLDVVSAATSATSLDAARGVLRRGDTDVVIVDHDVDGESGLDLVEHVPRQGQRRPAVIVFSTLVDPHPVADALQAGALGWLAKDSSVEELAAAVASVLAGDRWVTPRLRSAVIDALVEDRPTGTAQLALPMLSPRQHEVLECLVDGLTHAEAAERLHVSPNTVRTHVAHMCRMLDVHSTPALVALARAGRLASPSERRSGSSELTRPN